MNLQPQQCGVKRIQRRRVKGWRMPANAVYVGRGSQWGNPFVIGKDGDAIECIRKYILEKLPYSHHCDNGLMNFLISSAFIESLKSLRDKNLACWCPLDAKCHADWLLVMANSQITE